MRDAGGDVVRRPVGVGYFDSHAPLTERARAVVRQQREETAREEAAERERLEAPIREAEKKLSLMAGKLVQLERDRLLGKVVPDPDLFIDPVVGPSVRLGVEAARKFNNSEFDKFKSANPGIYFGDPPVYELIDLLGNYFDVNKLNLITALMIQKLVDRMGEAGLLPERPAIVISEPEPVPQSVEPTRKREQTFPGINPDTGEPVIYSLRQVNAMTTEDMRRRIQVLPTIKDLFVGGLDQ